MYQEDRAMVFAESSERWTATRTAAVRQSGCLALATACAAFAAGAGVDDTVASEALIDVRELAGRLREPDIALLDVRPAAQFATAHLDGAQRLPDVLRSDPSLPPAEVASHLGRIGLDGSEMVVLYGEPGDELDQGTAFFLLETAGVQQVRLLSGGIAAWEAEGLPVVTRSRDVLPVDFAPAHRRETTIEADALTALLGADGTVVVDVRTDDTWQPSDLSASYAAGHLPTALLYDFSRLLSPDGPWPLFDDGRRRLAELGPRAETPIDLRDLLVVYGEGPQDRRAALAYTLLRLLGVEARVHLAGWQGWRASEDRPEVRVVSARELCLLQRGAERGPEGGYFRRLPIIDLRELRDWEVGHVPGSFSMTDRELSRFFDLVVERHWPLADPQTDPLVLYCYGPDCIRSRDATGIALRLGWRRIYWFRDGVGGWFEAGYELERSEEGPRRAGRSAGGLEGEPHCEARVSEPTSPAG
jgi:thiosulfate/3-mercaptopyruvate sulfurtransferase